MREDNTELTGYDRSPDVVILGQLFRVYIPSRPPGSVIAAAGAVEGLYPTWDIKLHTIEEK
jgi:hypothetical protein